MEVRMSTITPTSDNTSPPRVVVGVDGSAQSKQALRWAARFAAISGARLDAVATWDWPSAGGWGTAPIPMNFDPHQDTEKVLTAAIDEVFGADRPKGLRPVVVEGNPARILLEESKGALMLVVGSRGHGGFAGLLLGSVSASVAEHAKCPVLVVHGSQQP
jgi:nucleotide-binding universal stress UspA family protein